jgi:hypothetical protein
LRWIDIGTVFAIRIRFAPESLPWRACSNGRDFVEYVAKCFYK